MASGRTIYLFLFAAVIISQPPPAIASTSTCSGGSQILLGGGGIGNYQKAAIEACGQEAQILLVQEQPYSEKFEKIAANAWRNAGAVSVALLNKDAPNASEKIANAAHIAFGANDQAALMEQLEQRPWLLQAIRKRHQSGALVSGNGGGAAIISDLVLISGARANLKSMNGGANSTRAGIGLTSGIIIDHFFVVRQRWARLIGPVIENRCHIGIGIDEHTWVWIRDNQLQVNGSGSVVLINAKDSNVKIEDGRPPSASKVAISLLRDGDSRSLTDILRGDENCANQAHSDY